MINNQQLLSFVERIERIEEDIAQANADKSEIYKEAKSAGFDVKAIKKCVALRKKDKDEIFEEDEILKLYREALDI